MTRPSILPGDVARERHRNSPQELLEAYATFAASLSCGAQAKHLRRRGAQRLLEARPDLEEWMNRPTLCRIAEARRFEAWPFLSWCFATSRLRPDVELLVCKGKGAHYTAWAACRPDDAARARAAAVELGWCAEWVERVARATLALVCLTQAVGLAELTSTHLDAVAAEIEASPLLSAPTRRHLRAEQYGLAELCFQLHLLARPPRHPNARDTTIADRLAAVPQPEIRRVMAHYLQTTAATVRPKTITERAASFVVFAEWLARAAPQVCSLRQLTRAHLESFLAWHAQRGWRGRVARDQRVSVRRHLACVLNLRTFFDDIAIWGWVERPPRPVLHRSDLPRPPAPLPRALPPDVDEALMAAVVALPDVAARTAIRLLRGTGVRLGELLDLEHDCVWELPGHGPWLKVPLGKCDTERVVPLDAATLGALREWQGVRGHQRALPHPRDGRPVDFLFVTGGHRMAAMRVRRALDDAVRAAGLAGPDGQPLKVTPHQLRHTYATRLANAGMSLQALMALLGHVTPDMTLRYAALANVTLREAYDAALARLRARSELPLVADARPTIGDQVAWLDAEMLKTRLASGHCSRHLAAGACSYANICEQCDNFLTAPAFLPALRDQLADETALRDDARARDWDGEVARHERVVASLRRHIERLDQHTR
jgi:site-specific recombinase XerD